MTFEEFFLKKKIDLHQLKVAEPALFAEFEQHYNQMGEKSFDHTKKYWFNPLRRKYHTPAEVQKVEKVIIENQLAEQTITDLLTEQSSEPAPKLGFKPKFSAGRKPVEPLDDINKEDESKTEQPPVPDTAAPKLGFKPKFKTPAPTSLSPEVTPEPPAEIQAEATQPPVPKLGFKPKFKAAIPVENDPAASATPSTEENNTSETAAPKLGFKPKFKSATIKPNEADPQQLSESSEPDNTPEPQPEPKPAYKPRFQAKNLKPKTGEE